MLETAHLILKKIIDNDVDLYSQMYKCPDTTRYLPNGRPYSDEQINELVEKRVTHWEYGFGTFTIFEKLTSKKIGYVGVEKCPNPAFSDIRYAIEISKRGRGYATIAAIECLRFTFGLDLHQKVYGASVCENRESIKLLQKLGMKAEPNIDIYGSKDLLYLSLSKSDFYRASTSND